MATRIIDLSLPLEPAPGGQTVEISHHPHQAGAEQMARIFGCRPADLPGGLGWATDTLTLSTHAGTHVDAPWHYSPTSEGRRARTIDEMPLEWFYGDGVIIDMRHKPAGAAVTVEDFQQALDRLGYHLKPGDIVLVQTGADRYWGTGEYDRAGCGMTRRATLWLIEQGIRVMGTDAWGWDRPFWAIRQEFQETGDSSIIWGAHYAGIDREYCHIEKLANLDKVPRPTGFKVACFPVSIRGGSAGWARVVAIVEEQ